MGNICGVRVEGKHPWPTCESHYELSTENNSLYTWVWASMQHPHGGVHAWTGGVLDCEDMHNDFVELVGPELAQELAYYSFIHRKYLYRYGIFKCEEPQDPVFTAKEVCMQMKCRHSLYTPNLSSALGVSRVCCFVEWILVYHPSSPGWFITKTRIVVEHV